MRLSEIKFPAIFCFVIAVVLVGASAARAQQQMRPGVRYTTGSYTISGWEHELVQGDKNLAHWNWSPMVGYRQSGLGTTQSTGRQATAAPDLWIPRPGARVFDIPSGGTHKQSVTLPFPRSPYPETSPQQVVHRSTQSDVGGKLISSSLNGSLLRRPKATVAAPSAMAYRDYQSYGSSTGGSGAATSSAVHGNIIGSR